MPLLPQYVFMAWCLVKHRDNLIFTNRVLKVVVCCDSVITNMATMRNVEVTSDKFDVCKLQNENNNSSKRVCSL